MTLRFPVAPMTATLGSLPPERDDEHWAYEVKWDGYRTIAFVDGRVLRLQSRRLLDVTAKYPEIGGLPGAVHAAQAVLDGELVCFDDQGRPSFEAIQRHDSQAVLHVFDVLSVDGNDTVTLPYERRRALLGELVEPAQNWVVPAHRVGDGAALLAATAANGLEGVMAKRLGSPYLVGKRTTNWRKIKNRIRAELTIGGFTAGSGNRAGSFGALLVGRPAADGTLQFAGGVGTGFDQATLEDLRGRLLALRSDECPFHPAPPREYRARGDVGAPRAARHRGADRVHERRPRPPGELHRARRRHERECSACGRRGERVRVADRRVPVRAGVWRAGLRGEVDVHEPEALAEPPRPLEVVQQRPGVVAADVDPVGEGQGELAQVGVEERDAADVRARPVDDRVVVGRAVLGDDDRRQRSAVVGAQPLQQPPDPLRGDRPLLAGDLAGRAGRACRGRGDVGRRPPRACRSPAPRRRGPRPRPQRPRPPLR